MDETLEADVIEFFENEFTRMNQTRHNEVTRFTFSPLHVVKGTTDVWAKGHRNETFPRSLAAKYGFVLSEMAKLPSVSGFVVASEKRGRRLVYVVTRANRSSMTN